MVDSCFLFLVSFLFLFWFGLVGLSSVPNGNQTTPSSHRVILNNFHSSGKLYGNGRGHLLRQGGLSRRVCVWLRTGKALGWPLCDT